MAVPFNVIQNFLKNKNRTLTQETIAQNVFAQSTLI